MDEVGHGDVAGILADLTLNDPRRASGDELLKIWPTNSNRRAVKAVLLAHTDGPAPDDPNNLVQEAHSYFKKRVREWITDDAEGGTSSERAERLRVAISDLLKLVTITLEPGDNAQVIFETLNARGTQLLALDLVKNLVFQEATRQGANVDQLHEDVWKPQLDEAYWRRLRRQGRLNRARAELFLTYWLGMKLREQIPATELFATFRRRILEAEPRPVARDLIYELATDAATLRSFDSQPPQSAEAQFFERLEALDVTTVMPLVLMLFTRREVDAAARRTSLRLLESWLVRRTVLRLTTKNYNKEISQLLQDVGVDPAHADKVIYRHFQDASGDASRWPDDKDVLSYLATHDAYGNIAGPRLVMVLKAIEQRRAGPDPDVLMLPGDLTVEHVMPRAWRVNWPLGEVADESQALERAQARDVRLNRLGNLTLVTGPVNSGMSNSAWPDKQKKLVEKTRLMLNSELLTHFPDRFDEGTIDRRTVQLAAEICSIWPGPGGDWIG